MTLRHEAPKPVTARDAHVREADGAPLRILFHINDFGKGGTETSLLAWLNALDRRHFAPAVSVAYPTDDLAFWQAHSIPADVPVYVLAEPGWMHGTHLIARKRKLKGAKKLYHKLLTYGVVRPLAARRFTRIARSFDIVCDYDFSLRHLAGRCDVPVVGVSHFSLATRIGNRGARFIARRMNQYRRYAAVAMITPAMAREAESLSGGDRLNLVELPNVIDIARIRRDATASVDYPANPYIVSVARLDEGQKDNSTLLRAFAEVRRRAATPIDLVLIGEGRDRAKLEQLAAELDIGAHVQFLGFRANPFPYIRRAEMLVLSSRYEGCPMVLGEAMAIGTPVVSADCPTGPRDLLDGGDAGLLVPPGDVGAMAAAIERLLTDSAARRAQIENANRKVASFAPENASRRMLQLVRRLRGMK
ncbi:glycosyltransferase [Paraburkholderia diazotrophica]|uniref:Glycosyltransferase involved in cell wall bisynthesis n=1 Tax=Paraburkholderia diazotrophica TaxID=667676 RepID=A0A1H6TJS4_9BURK|nr:glycosyltransferase [Paraburkholderia diazotrophica]SEI78434.1 Glycosyltransferase involved in cell wall bisynthesis [Paraburkholderia diazotrophica]